MQSPRTLQWFLAHHEKNNTPVGMLFFWCRWWDSNLTRETKKVLMCKGIINSVLHFVLHNLFFVHKYLRKIGLQLVLYGGLFLCHDVSVHTVDHVLCFVTHIVCDVVFGDVEGEHH